MALQNPKTVAQLRKIQRFLQNGHGAREGKCSYFVLISDEPRVNRLAAALACSESRAPRRPPASLHLISVGAASQTACSHSQVEMRHATVGGNARATILLRS